MKYILMCGGEYKKFDTPKHLIEVNGERIVDRTIRLLKENGVQDIYISSNNPLFDSCNVPRLENKDNYYELGKDYDKGWWLSAFYKVNEPVCYIWGDVYFSDGAIKTIVNYKTHKDILFGTSDAKNKYHNNWGEPFAYIVNDYKRFYKAIDDIKVLWDEGKIIRMPVVWELYRYLHKLDINVQRITEDYVCIDDGTIDIDSPEDIERLGNWK